MGDEERIEGFLLDQLFEDLLRDFVVLHRGCNLDARVPGSAPRRCSLR